MRPILTNHESGATLLIPGLHIQRRKNSRAHWRVISRMTAPVRRAVKASLSAFRHSLPPLPATVTIVRIAPRPLDVGDGLNAACSPVRDGVQDFYGVDDSSPLYTWKYDQRRGDVREYAVEIRIEARPWREADGAETLEAWRKFGERLRLRGKL